MKNFRFIHLVLALTLTAGLLGLAQPAQASVPLQADLWGTNGRVLTSLLSGSTLYIGGEFNYVGPPTGSFAALDASGGPDRAFPPINGIVYAIAPDGAGGWYVGGWFSSVGGHPRNHLAHLKADKSLDFAWNPNANGTVNSLVVAAPVSEGSGSIVYAAGHFTTIGGQTRNYIAALDASTGLATSWNPNASGDVRALAIAGGSASTIYAGGDFTSIGGQSRNYIAALDASTSNATTWNPNASGSVRSVVVAPSIAGASTHTIYAGGNFTSIGSQSRNRIAALDASTGLATDWNPNASGSVLTLAVVSPSAGASTIYAGGEFTSIGGQARKFIAALDASTGFATNWNPHTDGVVYRLAVSGSVISAGGWLTSFGGQARNFIAALDIHTGALMDWNPNADAPVYSLAAAPFVAGESNPIYAGGTFTNIGGQTRHNIAALDASTGLATPWNPDVGGPVKALVVVPPIAGGSGSTIYAGGGFITIGEQNRNTIAALDASTGLATAWDPNISGNWVNALVVSGSTIYAGGWFTAVGGQPRNNIAALDTSTGLPTAWNPGVDSEASDVYALAVSGSTIYVGGWFTSVGGQPRNSIAALNAETGIPTGWNPNVDGWVNALAVSDKTIYAGGYFSKIGGQSRNFIAALDASTGLATNWHPNANDIVHSLAIAPPVIGVSSNTIYAGGQFTAIGGQTHRALAALRDGAATCLSAASGGSWQASNWSQCGGTIPGDGDSVIVQPGHTITLYNGLAANDLTIRPSGELNLPLGSTLTLEGTLTHNGRLTQTLAAPATTATAFLNLKNAAGSAEKFFGLILTPTGDMGNTRVTIMGNQNCAPWSPGALIRRCFEIVPSTPHTATLRFYYPNAELNGQIYTALMLWRRSHDWAQVGDHYAFSPTCSVGQMDCWMEAQNVSAYAFLGLGSSGQPIARAQRFVPFLRR